MKKISTKDRLPLPDNYEDSCNTYYLIWTPFGKMLAMYMTIVVSSDRNTETGWFTSYSSRLICNVTHWLEE